MAHLRPGSHLAGENKIGNFVELKKATMGKEGLFTFTIFFGFIYFHYFFAFIFNV